ncbi:transcription elongation factor SPT6, partial [Cardiosporidium cionae]
TTPAGEMKLTVGHNDWLACRLFRVAPFHFLNESSLDEFPSSRTSQWKYLRSCSENRRMEDMFLDIVRLEQKGCLKIVIHPISSIETAPWKGAEFDSRCKEWIRKTAFLPHLPSEGENNYYTNPANLTESIHRQLKDSDEKDKSRIHELIETLVRLYCYPEDMNRLNGWIFIQKQILKRMIEVELFPRFRQEVRAILFRQSCKSVIKHCQRSLEFRLNMQPFRTEEEVFGLVEEDTSSEPAEVPNSPDSMDDLGDSSDVEEHEEEEENSSLNRRKSTHGSNLTLLFLLLLISKNRIFAMLMEQQKTGYRTHGVLIDEFGMLQKNIMLDYLMFPSSSTNTLFNRDVFPEKTLSNDEKRVKEDMDTLVKFLMEMKPECILVGVMNLECLSLHKRLKERILPLLEESLRPHLQFVGLEVPRLWASSEKCPKSMMEAFPREVLMCVSMGRLIQDPLSETLSLWDEQQQNHLLQLHYHSLQSCVPQERLEQALEISAMKIVAKVGVDINRIRFRPHLISPLYFVAGLGPRKTQELLKKMRGRDKFLLRGEFCSSSSTDLDYDRDDEGLYMEMNTKLLGPCIYQNCATFLRIVAPDVDESVDVLDNSRIHPLEGADIAQKMCRDCFDDISNTDDPVKLIIKDPTNLDALDLESFAISLDTQQDLPRMLPYISFIKEELKAPYKDQRDVYSEPTAEEIFYWATNESTEDLRVGSEVTLSITVTPIGMIRATIKPSGIRGMIADRTSLERDITEKIHSSDRTISVLNDKILYGRISQMDFERFDEMGYPFYRLKVVVTHSAIIQLLRYLLQGKSSFNPLPVEYLSLSFHHDIRRSLKPLPYDTGNPSFQKSRIRRSIRHPNFKPFSPQNAVNYLMDATVPLGECILRPSREIAKLVLMVKTCSDPFNVASFIINEKEQRIPGELGKELWLQGEKFQDLDQIIFQFADALKINLEELQSHPKFKRTDDLTAVVKELYTEVAAQVETIAYAICPPPARSGIVSGQPEAALRFSLIVIPPGLAKDEDKKYLRDSMYDTHGTLPHLNKENTDKKYIKDSIYVTHKKFKLWNKTTDTFKQLMDWWKTKGYWQRTAELAEYKKYQSAKIQAKANNLTDGDTQAGGVSMRMAPRDYQISSNSWIAEKEFNPRHPYYENHGRTYGQERSMATADHFYRR